MSKHLSDVGKFGEHKPQSNTEDGACLWGHRSGYAEVSCYYRWQAHNRAQVEDQTEIFHRYRKIVGTTKKIATSAYPTVKQSMYPARYCAELEVPEDGDWDVTGPRTALSKINRKNFKGKPVEAHDNFHKDTWPYWNQAHHLIPKNTLIQTILTRSGESKIATFIVKALLLAKYNVNHKTNMLLMPMDKEVAKILQMPRHIELQADGGVKGECADHPRYNAYVASKLNDIIDGYKDAFDKAKQKNEKHPEKAADLDKAKLEKLSKKLFKDIAESYGAKDGKEKNADGLSLDTIFG